MIFFYGTEVWGKVLLKVLFYENKFIKFQISKKNFFEFFLRDLQLKIFWKIPMKLYFWNFFQFSSKFGILPKFMKMVWWSNIHHNGTKDTKEHVFKKILWNRPFPATLQKLVFFYFFPFFCNIFNKCWLWPNWGGRKTSDAQNSKFPALAVILIVIWDIFDNYSSIYEQKLFDLRWTNLQIPGRIDFIL